jgi:hypothetical protein
LRRLGLGFGSALDRLLPHAHGVGPIGSRGFRGRTRIAYVGPDPLDESTHELHDL